MHTPIEAVFTGALAGLFGTTVLSVLSRLLPVPPRRSPRRVHHPEGLSAIPAGALAQSEAPGPEGLAEQFAFKVASGLFGHDISPFVRLFGLLVHFAYGSFWGVVAGLIQSSVSWPAWSLGLGFGFVVWLIGPALLVPAMSLIGYPLEESPRHNAVLILAHAAYGLTVTYSFGYLWG